MRRKASALKHNRKRAKHTYITIALVSLVRHKPLQIYRETSVAPVLLSLVHA